MFMIFFVIIASRCIQIRQQSILSKLSELNSKLTIKAHCRKRPNHALCWWQYLSLNREMLRFCKHIQVHSRYWSPYLTIMLPYYNIINCYLAYMSVVIDIPFGVRLFFILITIEIGLVFFALIKECAKVVKCNDQMLMQNRRFFGNFFAFGKRRVIGNHYSGILKACELIILMYCLWE